MESLENVVLDPGLSLFCGFSYQVVFFPMHPEHKYIGALIPVKVVGVCQEVVGVAIASTQFSGKPGSFSFFLPF